MGHDAKCGVNFDIGCTCGGIAENIRTSNSNDWLCAYANELEEAAQLISHWGTYASGYFQDKYDNDFKNTNHLNQPKRPATTKR